MHAQIENDPTVRNPWTIPAAEFPHTGSPHEQWRFLLRYAVLAPSSHNTQPWLFRIRDGVAELYADRTRACRVVDPLDRELVMSCGGALRHLRCAMTHFGCFGGVDLLPEANDPELLVRLRLGVQEETSREESVLFYAIPQRRTNRQPFMDDPVPPALVTTLREAAEVEFGSLHIVAGDVARRAAADLIAEGDRRQWADKRFRLELAAWVHPNRSAARDGIPGYAQGMDDLLSCAGPLVVRTFDMGEGQAAQDHQLATGSPLLAVLSTAGDGPRDWLHAGQALARVLLRARADGVWASFLNQAIELPDLRVRFRSLLGVPGIPQACLRLGYGDDIKPTPRRDVDEVLL